MTNTPLNPNDEARLEKALEQSANGQVVSRGSYAQYAETPLNPDGVLHAMDTLMAETDADERATEWAHKVTTRVLEGYFAVAQPVVTSLEELDAMPDGSVVKDSEGEVYIMTPYDEFWRVWGNDKRFSSSEIVLPARVIDLPEVKP